MACPILCVAVWLFLVSPSGAQFNAGETGGIVKDSSGSLLPGATVTARHLASGFVIERVTDSAGRFFLPSLRTGQWDIIASLPGFARQTQKGVVVEIGRTLHLELTLSVGGVTEEITVAATVPLLQTTTAEISDVIENREVLQLPLNGRNFLALAQLSDAVVLPPGGTRGEALQQAGPLPNVGGQRSGHNIYLLDGTKVTDELFNNLVINPSVDSIEEFTIKKSLYPAEFGGKASALINVATKAGSNRFHGSGFEFHRHDTFDSANYFHPRGGPIPPLRQNQFGGTLGGPLVRNRSFFFGSYEGQRMRRSLTRTFSVPPAAVRVGDFSGFGTICDPLTIPASGVCSPFENNRIPSARIDPIASAFLRHVAGPTSGAGLQNLTAAQEQNRAMDQFSIRLDHRVNDTDQVFARFSTFDAHEAQPFGTSVLQETLVPGFGRSLTTKTRNLAVSHTRVFGQSRNSGPTTFIFSFGPNNPTTLAAPSPTPASSPGMRSRIFCWDTRPQRPRASAVATRTDAPTGSIFMRRTTGGCAATSPSTLGSGTSSISTCTTCTTGCRRSTCRYQADAS